MNGCFKTFKVKEKKTFLCFHINDEKLLGKHKTIWTKIEDLRNIELNAWSVYDDRYIKSKIRTYCGKVYNKILIAYFDGINISKGIDPAKSNTSIKYIICHYRSFIMGLNFTILYVMVVIIDNFVS